MKLAATLLAVGLFAGFGADRDAPQLEGVRLEMAKTRVHTVLNRVADYKSQDENQEVWVLKNNPSLRSLIVGYAPDNHVRYVTALAKSAGQPLVCKPLGDLKKAQRAGEAGNIVYTHSWKEHGEEFVASARGPADHFTSCSVKKVGVSIENEEEEQRARKKP